MPRLRDKLTDPQVKHAQSKDRPYKLSDGAGMYLLVNPNGGKYWRLKYRFAGKEKVLALGVYPDVKLKDAREKRKKARALLDDHKDPSLAKKEQKRQQKIRAANTFEGVACEWHEKHKHRWTERHSNKVIRSLEQNVFAALGDRPIADITPVELLDVLRVIENRGALELASNVLQRCNAVFRYAIASLRAERNPATDLKGALKPPNPSNYASLSVGDLPEFLERRGGERKRGPIQAAAAPARRANQSTTSSAIFWRWASWLNMWSAAGIIANCAPSGLRSRAR